MQRDIKEFNKDLHDLFKCITVEKSIAEKILFKTVEGFVTTKKTKLSGEAMVVTEEKGVFGTLSFLAKVKVQPLESMDFEEVQNLLGNRTELLESRNPTDPAYVVTFSDVRPVIELPIFIQGYIFELVMDKGDVFVYPQNSEYLRVNNDNSAKLIKMNINYFTRAAVIGIGSLLIAGGFVALMFYLFQTGINWLK